MVLLGIGFYTLLSLIHADESPIRCEDYFRAVAVSAYLKHATLPISLEDARAFAKSNALNRIHAQPWNALQSKQDWHVLAGLIHDPLVSAQAKWRNARRHRFDDVDEWHLELGRRLNAAGIDVGNLDPEVIPGIVHTLSSELPGIHLMPENGVNGTITNVLIRRFGTDFISSSQFDPVHAAVKSLWTAMAESRVSFYESETNLSTTELGQQIGAHVQEGWALYQNRLAEKKKSRQTEQKAEPPKKKEPRDIDKMILEVFELIDPQFQSEFEDFFRSLPEEAQNALHHTALVYLRDPEAKTKYVKFINYRRRGFNESLYELRTTNSLALRLVGRIVDGKLQLVSFGLRRDLNTLILEAVQRLTRKNN